MPPLKWQLPTSFIARTSQMQLLSHQDLCGLYECVALLERILLFPIGRRIQVILCEQEGE